MKIHLHFFGNKFKTLSVFFFLMIGLASLAQTTITSGNTVAASTITAGNTVTINAGGTLNMDVSRNFTSLSTANSGTSSIIGSGTLTTGAVNLGSGNGSNTNTLDIDAATTVICTSISNTNGGNANKLIALAGTLKNSGTTTVTSLTCSPGSVVEYNGAAQNVFVTTYYNLTLSGSGTKTFTATTTINGTLDVKTSVIASLGTGLTHPAKALLFNGVQQVAGTWGYTGSGATNINTTFFANTTGRVNVTGRFYSNGGAPNLVTSWTANRNNTGTNPANFTGGQEFFVQNGHSITTTATWSVSGTNSKVEIENGGTLTASNAITLNAATTFQIDNGGTYIHNNTGTPSTTIFQGTEIFGASSNVRIDNWINTSTTIATGVSLPFGNLELNWNPGGTWSQTLSGAVDWTAGNFTITTFGSNELRLTAATTGTALTLGIGGNLSVASGILVLVGGGSAQTKACTVNVGGNVSLTGTGILDMNLNQATSGAVAINVGGDFLVSGTALLRNSLGSGTRTVTFNNASANQTFTSTSGGINTNAIAFVVGTGTSTNTLQLLSNFVMNNTASLTVANNASLNCGTNIVQATVANTAGSFTLSNGGTLLIGSTAGITPSGTASGNIQTSTARSFSTSGNYVYNGTGAQVVGTGLPATVGSLSITNASGVTLATAKTITNYLSIGTGASLDLGSSLIHTAGSLTLGGVSQSTGSSYGGTGSPAANISSFFAANTGVVNIGSCASYALTSTANTAACAGNAATVTVTASAGNLPIGSYVVYYTLTGVNTGSSSSAMTVSTAGTGSFATSTLSNIGATTITIDYIRNGCVSKITSGNSATITVGGTSTVPTSITGTAVICNGSNTTLTVNGGTLGSGAIVQWFTGSCGGASAGTGNSINVSPSSTTTYYVRYSGCNTTSCVSQTVAVNPVSSSATISGTALICSGTTANLQITIVGGTSPFTVVYSGGTLPSYTSGTTIPVSPSSTTNYTLTSVTDANGCPGTGLSGTATLTIDETTSTNGGAWSNGSPAAGKSVVFDNTNVTLGADFAACSLTLKNNSIVTIQSGTDVTLTGALAVEIGSALTFNNNANLIQSIPAGTSYTNSGNIIVKRNSSAIKRLDYTLWSSPVTGQGVYSFTPSTFGNRFYVYRTATNVYNNADLGFNITGLDPNGVNGTDSNNVQFATAKGYLIRMPWDHPTAATVWNGTFTGVPHNGDITFTMTNGGSGQRFNLVGNPYPSPINMTQFVSDNSAKITGTLYFWRETNNNTSNNAYCSWAGGTFTSNGEAQVFNPNGTIRTGQGFFVEASGASTTVDFKNGQRASDNSDQFFKASNPNVVNDAETNRFWLNLTNASGAFSQMAAGYMANATNGVDLYDGKNINTGNVLLNSILDNTDYTIQGKALPFSVADVIPLSLKITDAGNYTIAIDHVDGLFTDVSQPIYLKDNLTATEHNLQNGPYNFASDAGTFTSRFEVTYQSQLSIENPAFTTNSVIVYRQENGFIVNSGNVVMDSIKVFDIRGRLLEERKAINASQAIINGGVTNQVLLVQVTSEDGITITKKVIK